MNKKYFENLVKNLFASSKKFLVIKNDKMNLVIFSFLFMVIVSLVFSFNTSTKKKRLKDIDAFLSNNQTVLLKNYLLNQIKSPYLEYDYVVKNNDTVGSILKKFSVKDSEVNFIVQKIRKKQLSNIIPNQKMKFVLKRTKNKKDMEILKIHYPISKTTFVNIDKRQGNFLILMKKVRGIFY